MTLMVAFGIGAAFAFVLSLVVVLLLRPHLARLLAELCGSSARASFWVVTGCLWVLVLGLLAGTVSYGYGSMAQLSAQALFFGLVTQVRACLVGLLVSLMVVAWGLLVAIRRFELGLSPAPLTEPDPMQLDPYAR